MVQEGHGLHVVSSKRRSLADDSGGSGSGVAERIQLLAEGAELENDRVRQGMPAEAACGRDGCMVAVMPCNVEDAQETACSRM